MEILIILLLFCLNGFFSLSEMALITAKTSRLETMKTTRKKGVRLALKLQDESEIMFSSIQICITLVGFLTGFYGGNMLSPYIMLFFEKLLHLTITFQLAAVLSILIITFFAILVGELIPKTIALSKPEKIAVKVSPIIYFFSRLFFPFVKLFSSVTYLFKKILNITENETAITEDELKSIIKDASEAGVIEEEQNEIHENLFYYSDKKAKHIMTHRSEIEWIDIQLPETDFIQSLLAMKTSRVVVCDKELDDYLGVLRVKDYLAAKFVNQEVDVHALLNSPILFPETAEVHDILLEFKKRQFYFCLVLNEFGSVEGVVTLHDIMESILGEIPEEEEVVEPDICVREDCSVLVNGDAPIEVLAEVIDNFDIDFEDIDYATVAGFVLDKIEKIPEIGDCFDFLDYRIEILDVDHHRIDKILISKKK
jgi:putative hemolysin